MHSRTSATSFWRRPIERGYVVNLIPHVELLLGSFRSAKLRSRWEGVKPISQERSEERNRR